MSEDLPGIAFLHSLLLDVPNALAFEAWKVVLVVTYDDGGETAVALGEDLVEQRTEFLVEMGFGFVKKEQIG